MVCANCQRVESAETGHMKPSFIKYKDETVSVSDAFNCIFEGFISKNKVKITSDLIVCNNCLDSLYNLYKSYKDFLNLTNEFSYIKSIIKSSIVWKQRGFLGEQSISNNDANFRPKIEIDYLYPMELDDGVQEDIDYYQNDPEPLTEQNGIDRKKIHLINDASSNAVQIKPCTIQLTRVSTLEEAKKEHTRLKNLKLRLKQVKRKSGKKSSDIEVNDRKRFVCHEIGCTQSFNNSRYLRHHKIRCHRALVSESALKVLTCNDCSKPKVFPTLSLLKSHKTEVHATEFPFDCNICPKKFPTKNRLSIHIITKHGKDSLKKTVSRTLHCPHGCPDVFHSKVSINNHLKTIHNDRLCFSCQHCDRKYVREDLLNRHIKFKHGHVSESDLENRACKICSRVFEIPSRLNEHMKAVHSTEKLFKCDVDGCQEKFGSKARLNGHKYNKHDKRTKKYPCDQCGKDYFHSIAVLQEHIRTAHLKEKPFVCEHCGKSYGSSSTYRKHLQLHDPNRKRNIQCEVCLKEYYTQKSLRLHMKTHNGIKDKICDQCGNKFLVVSSLRRHLIALHGILPSKGVDSTGEGHTCTQCGKTFKLKEYLRQHLRSVTHGGRGHTSTRRREARDGDIDNTSFNSTRLSCSSTFQNDITKGLPTTHSDYDHPSASITQLRANNGKYSRKKRGIEQVKELARNHPASIQMWPHSVPQQIDYSNYFNS